jgi:hypothetical protein
VQHRFKRMTSLIYIKLDLAATFDAKPAVQQRLLSRALKHHVAAGALTDLVNRAAQAGGQILFSPAATLKLIKPRIDSRTRKNVALLNQRTLRRARDQVWWSGADGPNGLLLEAVLHEVDSFLHQLTTKPVPDEWLHAHPPARPQSSSGQTTQRRSAAEVLADTPLDEWDRLPAEMWTLRGEGDGEPTSTADDQWMRPSMAARHSERAGAPHKEEEEEEEEEGGARQSERIQMRFCRHKDELLVGCAGLSEHAERALARRMETHLTSHLGLELAPALPGQSKWRVTPAYNAVPFAGTRRSRHTLTPAQTHERGQGNP